MKSCALACLLTAMISSSEAIASSPLPHSSGLQAAREYLLNEQYAWNTVSSIRMMMLLDDNLRNV
jgi:hypothetical protein